MNIDEAIKILEKTDFEADRGCFSDEAEAINIAYKSLRRESERQGCIYCNPDSKYFRYRYEPVAKKYILLPDETYIANNCLFCGKQLTEVQNG